MREKFWNVASAVYLGCCALGWFSDNLYTIHLVGKQTNFLTCNV